MARDGTATRGRILDVAMKLALAHGYGGMSVDKVIAGAGITKGAFFHHFKTKNDMAHALLNRYVENDDALLHDLMGRAESLSHDPLQQYLIFVGLLVETMKGAAGPPPGCLVASYIYQMELFTPETQQAVIDGFREWERVLVAKLDEALATHPPKLPVTSRMLYENLMALFEGGVIMSKLSREGGTLVDQVTMHKQYVELILGQHD